MTDKVKQARVWVKSIKSLLGTDCRTDTIEALNTIERGLDALDKKPDPLERFVPRTEESYFIVNDCGDSSKTNWCNDAIDRFRLATGNCYRTREQANKVAAMLKRIIELRGDFKVDLNNYKQHLWSVDYIRSAKSWMCSEALLPKAGGIPFPTKEAGETLIREFGDDLFLLMGRI